MLLATATPIQLYPIELWDLLNILSQKNDSVLGSQSSYWRKNSKIQESLDLLSQRIPSLGLSEGWEWIRNPFPPGNESPNFKVLRSQLKLDDESFLSNEVLDNLKKPLIHKLKVILTNGFFKNNNPYIRHVVRRERAYLENNIDPKTGEPFLKRINVELHGEADNESLVLTGYMKQAYELADEFCKLLSKRVKSAGFLKTLLLKRIGSSLEAGRNTGLKMLSEWGNGFDDFEEEEDFESSDETKHSELKDLTPAERRLLESFVSALESNEATDPKYSKTVELLKSKNWKSKGVIIFSQYFDTTRWVAEKLSEEFNTTPIALYAGGDKSGVFIDGNFSKENKDIIKLGVKKHKYKILVGTDSASEGLNLQALGTLINLDLPWNPTRLEQRKGRIQRIGQVNDTVHIYNMRYKDSVEDRVHDLLSERLQSITSIFGQLPDVLEDVWIQVAKGNVLEAEKIIGNIPNKNPFEIRYNQNVNNIDWDSCTEVLSKKERRAYFKNKW
jgi:SNF2 family DNA or RNA helicase